MGGVRQPVTTHANCQVCESLPDVPRCVHPAAWRALDLPRYIAVYARSRSLGGDLQ